MIHWSSMVVVMDSSAPAESSGKAPRPQRLCPRRWKLSCK